MSPRHDDDQVDADSWRKRGRVACTACRQAKVRCNLSSIPCSRCERLSIDCSVNPGFKRVNKRDKVDELEDSVHRLKSMVEQQQSRQHEGNQDQADNQHTPSGRQGGLGNTASQASPPVRSASVRDSVEASRTAAAVSNSSSQPASDSRTIGNISVDNADAQELFRVFFERFHRFLPVLDTELTVEKCYEKCPLLFWCIISVALRSRRHDPTLLVALAPELTTRLWIELGSGRHDGGRKGPVDINDISCLLLLATWPLPGTRFWSDRSLLMSNMAMSSAMHLGFHRPAFSAEYSKDLQGVDHQHTCQRSALWVANFSLCTSLALDHGQVPLVPIDDGLVNRVRKHSLNIEIPLDLRHQAIMQKTLLDSFAVLFRMDNEDTDLNVVPDFYSHLLNSEKALTNIDQVYGHEMSTLNKIRSQSNLLLLQSMYFMGDHNLAQTKQGLLRAFETAIGLISLLMDQVDTENFFVSAPYMIVQVLFRSSFVMLRIFFSSYSSGLGDVNVKILFNAAGLMLRSISLHTKETDQPTRVADALKLVWTYFEKDRKMLSRPPVLNIRSRYGANPVYDCLIYWRKAAKRGTGQILITEDTGANPPTPSTPGNAHTYETGFGINTAPTYEDFASTDLSWFEYLVDPALFPE